MMDVKISDFYFIVIVANKKFSVEWSSLILARSVSVVWMFLTDVQVSCQLLNGERVEYEGAAEGSLMTLTNYRLHIRIQDNIINVSVCVMIRLWLIYWNVSHLLTFTSTHDVSLLWAVTGDRVQNNYSHQKRSVTWQKESHNDDWHDLCSLFDMCWWCVSGSSSAGWERRMSGYDSTASHL